MSNERIISIILGIALIVSSLGYVITGILHTLLVLGAGIYLIAKK